MKTRFLGICAVVVFTILGVQCGGSTPPSAAPTAPSTTTPGKGTLVVKDVTVTGKKTKTGFIYTIRVAVQNTGTAVANISETTLTFSAGGTELGTVSLTDAFGTTAIKAGGSQNSQAIKITDEGAGHPYAEMLVATVAYAGGAGSENATKSVPVPALSASTLTAPPSTVTLTRADRSWQNESRDHQIQLADHDGHALALIED